jgi:hypothetical protein
MTSYLREGSIVDNPDGSTTIVPFFSRTPFLMYAVGFPVQDSPRFKSLFRISLLNEKIGVRLGITVPFGRELGIEN